MKRLLTASLSILIFVTVAMAQDPGWPRQIKTASGTLVYYQPQVDEWKAFTDISGRMAFSLTPTNGKQVVGVLEMQGHTDVDNENKMVTITGLKVTKTYFPALDAGAAAQMDSMVRTFLSSTVVMSLQRLVACVPKPETSAGVPVNNDPPEIVTSFGPAILVTIDGMPALAAIPKTDMEFVVNTTWPLFFDKSKSTYYLLIDQQWATANSLDGPWSPAAKLPSDMAKVAEDSEWTALRKVIPPPIVPNATLPQIFQSSKPAEIILFDGKPVYSKIPGTQLLYATNTASYLFLDAMTNQYYYLTGGRWFRAGSLQGPWNYATNDLPADFARIPSIDPASIVLSSVPGTEEAKDSVLLARIPTAMLVNTSTAAAAIKVTYGGEPNFEPITGTTLSYATNTQDKVIKVGDVYYLCFQGVWFMSTMPVGPWTVASSVPQVIYTIPATSPVYNVTYVTQVSVNSGTVQSSYTAGYLGAFVVGVGAGAIIANGTGYYYPAYIYHPPYGYPMYYPYPATYGAYGAYGTSAHYNAATGAYGVSQTVSGPYGTATRGAAYNPYTGTSARGATASTPYGSRSVGQAYNPYTGNYAATSQGSSPKAQWGSSVVSNGNQSATAQHYSTDKGTVASAQTSSGAKAAGTSTALGSSTVAKSSDGNMYATHDGNVYKKTGSGWQSYDSNGNWNSVDKPTQPAAQQEKSEQPRPASAGASSSQSQSMQQEEENRQRGAQQSQRFEQSRGGGGSGGGGERSGGGGFGGGGRRR